jgi:hypothetical protein
MIGLLTAWRGGQRRLSITVAISGRQAGMDGDVLTRNQPCAPLSQRLSVDHGQLQSSDEVGASIFASNRNGWTVVPRPVDSAHQGGEIPMKSL